MKIKDILNSGKPSFSIEVFPPKTEDKFDSVERAAMEITKLAPSFMSVTYGAGGGTSQYTADIAERILAQGVTPLAHITCVSSTREKVHTVLDNLKAKGIENVLALRGDIPKDGRVEHDYRYASELIAEIKASGDFCIGAACYPEGHPESLHKEDDIGHLKEKVEAGADFVTTQMFFDNHIMYNFLYRVRERGITVPVIAGIMPITAASQVGRSVNMSGSSVPQRFKAMVDKFGDNPAAMKQAGIAYATEQIVDLLANHVNGIHIYSMNKPDVAAAILANVSELLKVDR
ncbi:MAG: methylenetetrahydrofolate reductase [NAD(P)H] [Clostridiales bacterium]|nr:methylenetetrahydrofolate reductase [NAD(P)H] [Clostridiales bacterium]